MKKKFLIFAAMAATILSSCKNEMEEEPVVENEKEFVDTQKDDPEEDVVLASIDLDSKTLRGSSAYLYDIKAISAKSYAFPDYYEHEGKTYRRLTIDMNDGAAGNYIYLYYAMTNSQDEALTYIRAYSQKNSKSGVSGTNEFTLGTDFSGRWIDMNEGAKGAYVYMSGFKHNLNQFRTGIKHFKVVSHNYKSDYAVTKKKFDGRTYYPVATSDPVNNPAYLPVDFNAGTKKHKRYVTCWFSMED